MIPAAVMMKLATLGLSPDHAEAVAQMLADVEQATKAEGNAAIETRRANDRERKSRQRHGKSRDVTGQDVTERDTPPSPSLPPQTPPTRPHPPENNTPAREGPAKMGRSQASKCFDKAQIVEALATVLDAEHAEAVADYRTMGRKDKFSLYAAQQLAKELAKAPDPNGGADAMIRNGWQGFEAHWLERRSNLHVVNGHSPPRSDRDRLNDIGRRMLAEERGETEPQHWQGGTIDGYAQRRQ